MRGNGGKQSPPSFFSWPGSSLPPDRAVPQHEGGRAGELQLPAAPAPLSNGVGPGRAEPPAGAAGSLRLESPAALREGRRAPAGTQAAALAGGGSPGTGPGSGGLRGRPWGQGPLRARAFTSGDGARSGARGVAPRRPQRHQWAAKVAVAVYDTFENKNG